MQDYRELAEKNGVTLIENGNCQFCGAKVKAGIKECLALFNNGFNHLIDYREMVNMRYKFLSVDAHTLQHSEIHGRWNNHLHLTRLHLILHYKLNWSYSCTPKLSKCLNAYKKSRSHEYLLAPAALSRGPLSITDVLEHAQNERACKASIQDWATGVYKSWSHAHSTVDGIAKDYIERYHD